MSRLAHQALSQGAGNRGAWMSIAVFGLATLIGIVAFLYPFWIPAVQQGTMTGMAHSQDAPFVLALLTGICFVVLLLEVQSAGMSAKTVALLGVLIAINSLLRFIDLAVPGPGGFSPIFLLIILVGYVYGPRMGFLMGALTLLVSSLVTGAMGPWLPYQMFTAGWTGMTAALCRPLVRMLRGQGRRREVWILAAFAGLWGLLYGVIMNIWFWPFIVGAPDQYWQPGISWLEAIQRYALFYLVTSLGWDTLRLAGNVGLFLVFGAPALRVLQRFHRRFTFVYVPVDMQEEQAKENNPPSLPPIGGPGMKGGPA